MTLPVQELLSFSDLFFEETNEDIIDTRPQVRSSTVDPDEEDDDFDETYGDLEDGHDDLDEPESDRGVANLE